MSKALLAGTREAAEAVRGWPIVNPTTSSSRAVQSENKKREDHVHLTAIAGERQQQPIDLIGRAADKVRERLQRMQRLPSVYNTIVLLDDDRMYLKETGIFFHSDSTV